MTMAILALLAWKAVKHFSGSQPGAAPRTRAARLPGNVTASLPGGGAAAVSATCSRADWAACSQAARPAAC